MNSEDRRIVAGLEAQARLRATVLAGGARHLGWKAGLGAPAALEKHGIGASIVGFLTDATLADDGAAIAIGGWGKAALEPEVAVRLGADLAPGASRDATLAAIADVGPAIELVDLDPTAELEAILAGNVFHRQVLLGQLRPLASGELSAARLEVRVEGQPTLLDVDPSDALGDLADVVRALADQLPAAGERMRAGDVVITGSAVPAIALAGGERVAVTLAGAGSVAVAIA